MKRLTLALLLTGCPDTPRAPEPAPAPAREAPEDEPDVHEQAAVKAERLADSGDLFGVVCLRLDQLRVHRSGLKQVNQKAMRVLLVDQGDDVRTADDYYNALMDLMEVVTVVGCYDDASEKCIQAEGRGAVCHNLALKECEMLNIKPFRSHCVKAEPEP